MNIQLDNVDLLPGEYKASQRTRKRIMGWTAIAFAAGIAVFVTATPLGLKAIKLESQVAPLRERVVTMESWVNELVPMAAKLESARKQQIVVNRLLNEPSWSHIFSDLAAAIDGNLWLGSARIFRDTVTGETVTEETASEGSTPVEQQAFFLRISGAAKTNFDIIRFMTKFSESKYIASIDLEMSKTQADSTSRSPVTFDILAMIE